MKQGLIFLLLLLSTSLFAYPGVPFSVISNNIYFQDGVRLKSEIAQMFEWHFTPFFHFGSGLSFGMGTQPMQAHYPGNLFHINLNGEFRYRFVDAGHYPFVLLRGAAGLVAVPIQGGVFFYDWLPQLNLALGLGYAWTTFSFRIKDLFIGVHLEPMFLWTRDFYLYDDSEQTSLIATGNFEFCLRFSFYHPFEGKEKK